MSHLSHPVHRQQMGALPAHRLLESLRFLQEAHGGCAISFQQMAGVRCATTHACSSSCYVRSRAVFLGVRMSRATAALRGQHCPGAPARPRYMTMRHRLVINASRLAFHPMCKPYGCCCASAQCSPPPFRKEATGGENKQARIPQLLQSRNNVLHEGCLA